MSETLAACNYCQTGTEEGDSCKLDNGELADKTPGCPGALVASTSNPLNDACQCIEKPPYPPCIKTNDRICSDGTRPKTGPNPCGLKEDGKVDFGKDVPVWVCTDPNSGPSEQSEACLCQPGLSAPPEAPAPVPVTGTPGLTGPSTSAKGLRCIPGSTSPTTTGEGIMTAIGCIPTQPQKLVEGLLRYGTLAAGGIAFLLMLLAGLQMITAEGNPETIKHAQERFYSAIIGLLLIIFSVLLMQVIGMDLLGLKGFS